jgi:hypothetical protein
LYAYKCKQKDYNYLKQVVTREFERNLLPRYSLTFPLFFCLYAAETWRRNHVGGPWKWETVFADVLSCCPNYQLIYEWVRKGLTYWSRPILNNRLGHNEYLVTIACEGGLPLLLLKNEKASLYRYFKKLLESYHKERHSPYCDAETVAIRNSAILPKALRHSIVFKLGGDLVQKILELQDDVQGAGSPLTALDEKHPNWRDRLPLSLEDETAQLLLKNLVIDASKIVINERQRVLWRRRLVLTENEINVEQWLEVPNTFLGATLQRWSNREELPGRMRLFIRTKKGTEPVALITRLRGEGQNAIYRCEVTRKFGIRMTGMRALCEIQLILSDGNKESIVPVQGENGWGALPWVFANRGGQMECIGEGSVRCRDSNVLVLFPNDGRLIIENGNALRQAAANEFQRELWEVRGTVCWEQKDRGTCRIRCTQADAVDVSYMLTGERLKNTAEQSSPFVGVPNLLSVNQNSVSRAVEDAFAEWRPDRVGEYLWRRDLRNCTGEVWLRWTNRDNEQVFCQKVRVVPCGASVDIDSVGGPQKPGKLALRGFGGGAVVVKNIDGCSVSNDPENDLVRVELPAGGDLPVTNFQVDLFWPAGSRITLTLPFPREGAAFVYADEVLTAGTRVPVAKMAAVQVIGQTHSVSRRFTLTAKIKAEAYSLRDLRIQTLIPIDANGRSIYQLHRIQERISSILSLTGEMDSIAILEVMDLSNLRLAHLEVGQFDMHLEADWDGGCVSLPGALIERLEIGWEERISVRMVPLWSPADMPLLLEKGDGPAEWIVPDHLAPGPWWIIGQDGDWARIRPLLWLVAGEPETANSRLKRAILTPIKEIREELLANWVENVAQSPDHEDWPLFFDYLELLRPYPASALDLFRHFVRSPEAMVLALLKSSDEDFDAIWSLSYQLPFSWYLVPVMAWLSSAKRYFASLQVALDGVPTAERVLRENFEEFRGRVTVRRPFFRQICDWLHTALFPGEEQDNSELAMAIRCPEIIHRLIQEEEFNLQNRHEVNEIYPEGPAIMRWTERPDYPVQHAYRNLGAHLRPVRCAPFVAAFICVNGESYQKEFLFELKRLRDFDRDWFTQAFALALCLGLSQTPAV